MGVKSGGAARSWSLLADRIAREKDPRRRANLELVARHVEAEVAGDLPLLMATLVPEPVYEIWGASHSDPPRGRDAVLAFYQAMMASGKNRLEFEVTRVVADDHSVVTEGIFRHAYTGDTVRKQLAGFDDIEPNRWYLIEYRSLIVWPITEGGLVDGEIIYAGEFPRVVRPLGDDEYRHLGPISRT